ncbi:BEL1-like homeodomain protein 6 [Forsythia ovata]|uniref:BEL1-like homeodomain protein 6 n=1 Tax=Forsythia ovata TaxID=205694 RepID=A0ABD1QLG0_9LAMI
MATCFPSSNNQRDSATMLYLRVPLPGSYSETPVLPGNMMMYTNFSQSSDVQPVGGSDSDTSRQETLSNLVGSRTVDHDFNMIHPMGGVSGILQGATNLEGRGLSLSLSTQEPSRMNMSSIQYLSSNPNFSTLLGSNPSISGETRGQNGSLEENDDSQIKQSRYDEYMLSDVPGSNSDSIKANVPAYGVSSIANVIPNSKYLKAAQQLLDEVVNVRQAIMEQHKRNEFMKTAKESDGESGNGTSDPSAVGTSSIPQDSSSISPSDLSAAKKQDVQDRITKLYQCWTRLIEGSSAAKSYTALALKTISRHFRSLRDAINGQICVARRSLGEEDSSANGKGVGISRLRYVDQQLRQQRALQQLGMMQPHAWRPQRGLPESSVSILRAWLFEHFLHPYPKDSDKTMLARQTGLTRSQVSNWFINARVRLWKPMVEEMYKKEVGDVEIDSNSSSESAQKALKTDAKASDDLYQTATSTENEHCRTGQPFETNSDNVNDVEMVGSDTNPTYQNLIRAEPENGYGIGQRRVDQKHLSMDDRSLFPDTIIRSNYGDERFMEAAYQISELERFGSGNGVSLTLRLQGGSLPVSDETRRDFVTMRGNDVYNVTASSTGIETPGFDFSNSGNQQHEFVSSRILHDFVA